MNGIINVYKEPGWTSFDVVARLRRILKQKKIGHTGTLDPAAEGVLPVCLGKATKLCDFLTDGTKTYEAVLLLGTTTDTLDMEGEVLKTSPVCCSEEEVRSCIASFLGEQEQVPPMYSALKVNGKRLYELARAGQSVERKARKVVFYALDVQRIALPRVKIRVVCSKGTYIRSLCADIGEKLGCGGCMEKLKRTASSSFTEDTALRLSRIEELAETGEIGSVVLPMDRVFEKYPAVYGRVQADKALHNGNAVPARLCEMREAQGEMTEDVRVRMYDSAGTFIGLYAYQRSEERYAPVKILYETSGC